MRNMVPFQAAWGSSFTELCTLQSFPCSVHMYGLAIATVVPQICNWASGNEPTYCDYFFIYIFIISVSYVPLSESQQRRDDRLSRRRERERKRRLRKQQRNERYAWGGVGRGTELGGLLRLWRPNQRKERLT